MATLLFIVSCSKGGSITSSSSSSVQASLGVSEVYPSSVGSSWTPVVVSSRYYIKGLALTMSGVCDRGIATIQFNEGGANYPETATCTFDGTWTFSKIYVSGSGEGDKTVVVQGYDSSNLQISQARTTVDVRIDNTAPSAPVITVPGTTPYSLPSTSTTYTITGTCSCVADGVSKITFAGNPVTISGNTWSYVADVSGDSSSFTFYAWDIAGNQSAGRSQVFEKDQIMKLSGAIPGQRASDAVHGFDMDFSAYTFPGSKLDPFTSYDLETGFNFILKEDGHQ